MDPEATVGALIDHERGQWRRDVISVLFLPIDIKRILNVPIQAFSGLDARVWAASKDGIFRVRDAYSLAMNNIKSGDCSSGSDPSWKTLWKLHIHPKAKIFLWRALWDILPHGVNLRQKGISVEGRCSRCGSMESNTHVLRDCPWALKVGRRLFKESKIQQDYVSIREWFGMILQEKTSSEAELFAVILW